MRRSATTRCPHPPAAHPPRRTAPRRSRADRASARRPRRPRTHASGSARRGACASCTPSRRQRTSGQPSSSANSRAAAAGRVLALAQALRRAGSTGPGRSCAAPAAPGLRCRAQATTTPMTSGFRIRHHDFPHAHAASLQPGPVQRRRNQVKHVTVLARRAQQPRNRQIVLPAHRRFEHRALVRRRGSRTPVRRESSSAGIVRLTRSNGASGGSGSGVRRRTGSGSSACGSVFGNSEAMCPSLPMPSQASAKCGGRAASESAILRRPAGSSSARIRPALLASWLSGTTRSSPGQTSQPAPSRAAFGPSAARIGNGVEPPGTVIATSPSFASPSALQPAA